MDVTDDSDRPTLPYELNFSPEPASAFDHETELFLSNVPTWPAFAPVDLKPPADDPGTWWADERRRALRSWVTATMALCAGLLAAALLIPLAAG